MTSKKEPTIEQRIMGMAVLVALGWFGWTYLMGDDAAPDQDPAFTLSDYRELSKEQRSGYLSAALATIQDATASSADFTDCMGDFAFNKTPELLFSDVLGWCQTERETNPERFIGHFNELDAPDLSAKASIICKDFVRDQLKAPATAEFPTLDFSFVRHGGNHWTIKSYVDAQNGFGAKVRSGYICDMQYDGVGDVYSRASWKLLELRLDN